RYHIASQISTNGHFLEGPMLDELFAAGLTLLKVSIDTPNAELYTRYRVGGDFERVVHGFRHAVARKRALGARTTIEAQYIAMRDTEDLDAIIAHGRELGADQVRVKTLGIGSSIPNPTEKEWSLMPEADELDRYVDHNEFHPKVHWDDARCTYIWRRMVLNADGKCLPCSHDQLVKFELGTIKNGKSLASVWNGP